MTSTEYLLLGMVAGIDYITSTRYVLELSPCLRRSLAFFTWFVGKRAAAGLGLVCAGIGLATRLHSISGLSAFWDTLVWLGLYLAAILVLSRLKQVYERERSLLRLDPLTHVGNRRALLESASVALSLAKRQKKLPDW